MGIFEGIQKHARHPLLRDVITLITRDESRHMGFGVLYVAEWMRTHSLEEQIDFARMWLGQMLMIVTDKPGPLMLSRLTRRLQEFGIDNIDEIAPRMLREQQAINAAEIAELKSGRQMPHLLKSARRAGLLKPEILEALGVSQHPIIAAAIREPQAV
jgi:hypothetical protein